MRQQTMRQRAMRQRTMRQRAQTTQSRRATVDRPPRAFSLLEMLLVLVLLVTLAGLSYPALRGSLGSHRLREGAKSVRIELAKARLRAMESGRTCILRYEPGERRFRITWRGPALPGEQSPGTRRGGSQQVAKGVAPSNASGKIDEEAVIDQIELPDGVVFAEENPTRGIDSTESVTDSAIDQTYSDVDSTDSAGWSDAVIFYPDGRTSDSQLLLRNEREAYVMVTLRGLTGVVKISELLGAGEFQ